MNKKRLRGIIAIIVVIMAAGGLFYYFTMRNVSVGMNASTKDEDNKEGKTLLDSEKTLVVYFSYGGNTQKLAKEVSDQVGGDFRKIEVLNAYPDGDELYDYTKEEQDNDERPEIKDLNIDISEYDTIFIGYPIWWYTYPQVILTFFDTYDMSGKTIVPFVTHGGSGMSGTEQDMREYLSDKNVTVLSGLAVSRNVISGEQSETVSDWLKELGYLE